MNSTARFGQGTTTFSPGIIRLNDFRPVLRSINVREMSNLSMTTLFLETAHRGSTSIFHLDDVEVPGVVLWLFLPTLCGIFEEVPILNEDLNIQVDTAHPVTLGHPVSLLPPESSVFPPN